MLVSSGWLPFLVSDVNTQAGSVINYLSWQWETNDAIPSRNPPT